MKYILTILSIAICFGCDDSTSKTSEISVNKQGITFEKIHPGFVGYYRLTDTNNNTVCYIASGNHTSISCIPVQDKK